MAKLIFSLLLILVLSYWSHRVNAMTFKATSLDVDWKLKQLNKPAVKTIHSEDGDIIDCVDIYKQPAFDHPALKDHVIQMEPSFELRDETPKVKNNSSRLVVFQTWQRSGRCPEGTVPVRREDLLRANSVNQFGRKPEEVVSRSNIRNHKDGRRFSVSIVNWRFATANRSAATIYIAGVNSIGAKGDINVWNPNVESEDDFTTAQIWLAAGSADDFESLEAGWMVNPKFYGDKQTRVFISWTKDSYRTTGCFDLTCSGFVQTSPKIALGSTIKPVSSHETGDSYQISFGFYMDPNTKNWWLHFGDGTVIGYWPASKLLSYMNESASSVEWGGQVYSPGLKKTPHSKTGMGSGEFALGIEACYLNNIGYVDISSAVLYLDPANIWTDESKCYNASSFPKTNEFYFGGPGQNAECP